MKVFLSHSSRNKPLVREVKSYFPEHVKLWIDEKDLLVGENIDQSLQGTISEGTDYLIFFIDQYSLNSAWVRKEIQWAMDVERRTNRTFVLPILLDRDSLDGPLPDEIKNRKYLSCFDYSEAGIRGLASSLISELFAWLSRDLDSSSAKRSSSPSEAHVLDEADQITAKLADQIRLAVYPYRKDNPTDIESLHTLLKATREFQSMTLSQFLKLVERLQQRGYLCGIVLNGTDAYVEEEHFSWKTSVFSDAKKRIARKALSYIRSNQVVAMDAGSTTLELAKQIGQGLRLKAWNGLTVVTNSFAGAYELLTASSEMGWDDETAMVKVYIIGGRIRPNTLAVVNDNLEFKQEFNDDFKNMLDVLGGADVAFVGTNGVHRDHGFSTHNNVEIYTKQDLLAYSRQKVILADPSKFGIAENKVFAGFDEDISIITVREGFEQRIDEYVTFFNNRQTRCVLA